MPPATYTKGKAAARDEAVRFILGLAPRPIRYIGLPSYDWLVETAILSSEPSASILGVERDEAVVPIMKRHKPRGARLIVGELEDVGGEELNCGFLDFCCQICPKMEGAVVSVVRQLRPGLNPLAITLLACRDDRRYPANSDEDRAHHVVGMVQAAGALATVAKSVRYVGAGSMPMLLLLLNVWPRHGVMA